MQNLAVLGATGSIGTSTLDVVKRHPDRFKVRLLTANSKVQDLAKLAAEYNPDYLWCPSEERASELSNLLSATSVNSQVLFGERALCEVCASAEIDTVMAAIVGGAGLRPTFSAVEAGKKVLLANKESLVMSGSLFMGAARDKGALLLPVDSEHNAIFQSLPNNFCFEDSSQGIKKILLTGSGGPFLNTPIEELDNVTPEQACAHPNWDMGQKISVDSATMMNKGLEFIEAHWLFSAPTQAIQVVIHPQSIIHSMVQYADGSVLSQMGQPDMRTPIAHVMAYPERIDAGVASLDFSDIADLTFQAPDFSRFPNLKLAIDACEEGQWACTALNAANEIAVEAFLHRLISFTDINRVNQAVVENMQSCDFKSIDEVIEFDMKAREQAQNSLRRYC